MKINEIQIGMALDLHYGPHWIDGPAVVEGIGKDWIVVRDMGVINPEGIPIIYTEEDGPFRPALGAMLPIATAPQDGSRIQLFRINGDAQVGRWAVKDDSECRTGPQWLSDDDKYLDIPMNPVVGWSVLQIV